ncbi:MAG TPA: HAMP domain-containing sensor histidine kinase [Candidatus Limnocylindria bacterium]|nr:HAMP domain-containing sensor histidine kinase [Candidatus Limnocylindria bacterium]
MSVSAFSRRVVGIIGLGVALPAVLLASLGIFLTLRISSAVEAQSRRYHLYMAQQMSEGFEQELMSHLRASIALAENVARSDGGVEALIAALAAGTGEFEAPHYVPIEQLTDYLLLVVESQPLVYGEGRPGGPESRFIGLMLRDSHGQVMGAGGWWFNPRVFLIGHLRTVMEERLASNVRIYGGIESTRNLSVALVAAGGSEIARMRAAGNPQSANETPLAGPFEGHAVRVSATPNAPIAWTNRFVLLEIAFIGLMAMVVLGATVFGLRYTVRQLELAQIKASFVSNVSHELKTPIALIRLAVDTLELRRTSSPEETEKFLNSISREAMRLNRLVDNILDFARLEAGQHAFRFTNVNPAQLVRETVESFRPRLEDQGFKLELQVPDHLPLVRGDTTALGQCMFNLLDNAMKYSRQRRELKVAAEARNGEVRVSVTDRGIGIGPRDLRRVFEKFVRLETGLVHDVKGAGLGLSLVDQIMRAHGGRVEVDSTIGEGSTFTLALPVSEPVEAEADEPRAQAGS